MKAGQLIVLKKTGEAYIYREKRGGSLYFSEPGSDRIVLGMSRKTFDGMVARDEINRVED